MQIHVSKPELEQFVRQQVTAGHFQSEAEVIEAALVRMMDAPADDDLDDEDYARILRAKEQIDRGEVRTAEQVRTELRLRYSNNR